MAKNKKEKIIVCGAGIGGLTTAHELARRGFDVAIYERNPIVGGLARSRIHHDKKTGHDYQTEYSWRIYGTGYHNLLRLFKEIPIKDNRSAHVFDNLRQIYSYIFPRFDKEAVVVHHGEHKEELMEQFKKKDHRKMLNLILKCLTMSTARMDSHDDLTWKEYCKDLSPEAKKYMVRMWGPVLGMDPTYMSFPVVARMIQILAGGLVGDAGSLYLMNAPTNNGWFDQWTEYLQNDFDVKIKTNHEILDFEMEDGEISGVKVRDVETGTETVAEADYYVCAMSVEAIAKIAENNEMLAGDHSIKNTIPLAKGARQIQLSVQIFLNKKIIYPVTQLMVLYLPDTPWALIIEAEDKIWDEAISSDESLKTVLSVGICQTDAKGILHKKAFTECSPKEVEEEVWAQIIRSTHMSEIVTDDGLPLEKAGIAYFYMWDSFQYDSKEKKIDVWEPKFSNNANTLQYQPNARD